MCSKICTFPQIEPFANREATVKFKMEIPMFHFDVFAAIRYLPRLFGTWILNIGPFSQNLVWGLVTHQLPQPQLPDPFGYKTIFNKDFIGNGGRAKNNVWQEGLLRVTMTDLNIEFWRFRYAAWNLLSSEYTALLSSFTQAIPLRLPFTTVNVSHLLVANAAPGSTITNTVNVVGGMNDSLFITFHSDVRHMTVCQQPYMRELFIQQVKRIFLP